MITMSSMKVRNVKQIDFPFPEETKEIEKSILECRAKLCSNILKPDYQSRKDPRYCLDCMPF